jgi:hypothetical protein
MSASSKGSRGVDTMTRAYVAGLVDGADWDLDGYGGDAAAASLDRGFDAATIHARGPKACAKAWGVPDEGDEWEQAQRDYSEGIRTALIVRAVWRAS